MLKKLVSDKIWNDPILIIGFAISIGILFIPVEGEKAPGLIIGLLSAIITLLLDILGRLEKAKEQFLEANNLAKLFSRSTGAGKLKEMALDYDAICKYNFDHFVKLADCKIVECKAYIKQLASGSIYVEAHSSNEYSGHTAFAKAQKCVKCVDLGQVRFWTSNSGINYLRSNREATERGVKVQRIFAINPDQIEELSEVLKAQIQAGVTIKRINPDRIQNEFMLIDDAIRKDMVLDANGRFMGEKISVDPSEVAEAWAVFDSLDSFSTPIVLEIKKL